MYYWVDTKVEGTYSALSIEVVLRDADIVVGEPLEW